MDFEGVPAPASLISSQFMQRVWDGRPYTASRYISVSGMVTLEKLLPKDVEISRLHTAQNGTILLANTNNEVTVYASWTQDSCVLLSACSSEPKLADSVLAAIARKVPKRKVETDKVQLWLWHRGSHGPESKSKTINAPKWEEVSRNYSQHVAASLAEMVKVSEPQDSGKIILWHGVPGTGKTSAIRMLMREWKDWCSFHYVSDPEDLFKSPSYLMSVATNDTNDWRLVIAEDTDGLLRPDARNDSGSGLGRLLNFSDGILGQGTNTLFLLTTNVQLDSLHPALTRPGRCLAQQEFTKFKREEMIEWLPEGAVVPNGEKTLAELLDHVHKRQISTGLETKEFGNYL